MPRIVIPDDEPPVMQPSKAYERLTGCDVRAYSDRPSGPDALVERIGDAEIVINIRSTSRFTADVLARCPKLRLISIWGTGTDNVDLAAAQARGIRVTNTPGVAAIAVAEHTLALMMAVAKQLVHVDRQVRQQQWPRAMTFLMAGTDFAPRLRLLRDRVVRTTPDELARIVERVVKRAIGCR